MPFTKQYFLSLDFAHVIDLKWFKMVLFNDSATVGKFLCFLFFNVMKT